MMFYLIKLPEKFKKNWSCVHSKLQAIDALLRRDDVIQYAEQAFQGRTEMTNHLEQTYIDTAVLIKDCYAWRVLVSKSLLYIDVANECADIQKSYLMRKNIPFACEDGSFNDESFAKSEEIAIAIQNLTKITNKKQRVGFNA